MVVLIFYIITRLVYIVFLSYPHFIASISAIHFAYFTIIVYFFVYTQDDTSVVINCE